LQKELADKRTIPSTTKCTVRKLIEVQIRVKKNYIVKSESIDQGRFEERVRNGVRYTRKEIGLKKMTFYMA